MRQFQREFMIGFILLVCLSIYSHAFTAPSDILSKQVSYIEKNGLEYTLRDTVSLTVGEFVKFGLNKKATLSWEDGGSENYILVIILNDILTKYTNVTKILFTDRKNKDHVLMSRIIYNQEEINEYDKLTLIKQWTTGAVLEKRKASKGTYEEKRDMTQVTKFWQGGVDKGLQVENNFMLNDNTAIMQLHNRNYYKKMQNTYSNISSHVEDKDSDYVYIYLGFNESTHMSRHAFVRVNHQGIVQFSTIPPAEESDWKVMQ